MYRVQLWAIPGIIDIEPSLSLPDHSEFTLKCVKIERDSSAPIYSTLIEMLSDRPEISLCAQHDIPKLGQILSRLSFSLLTQFQPISARIIKTEPDQNGVYEESNCAGAPAGASLYEYKVGFEQQTALDIKFLTGGLAQNVDSAISWFLIGNASMNSLHQVMCHWIGLELLAPEIQGPYRCGKCGKDICFCSNCGQPTMEPKSSKTIRSYLVDTLGVSKDEFNKYYTLRNRISHGKLEFNTNGIQETSEPAIAIQQLLLKAIKFEMGWPLESNPNIKPEGLTIIGNAWLMGTCTYEQGHNFDFPACLPF